MTASPRPQPSGTRKHRSFNVRLANASNRPKGDLQVGVDERLENAPKRPLRSAEVPSGKRLLHLHHVVRLPALIVELDASAIEAKGDEEVAAVGGLDPV